MPRKLTQEEFLMRAKEIHGDTYDYSLAQYLISSLRIKIICHVHGIFEQRALNHLQGSGCFECRNDSYRISNKEFISRCEVVHNGKYDYSKTQYSSCYGEIIIICPKHGDFIQRANVHLRGSGCNNCFYRGWALSLDEFIEQAIKAHGGKYDYSLVTYNKLHDTISIICPTHGIFEQEANNHVQGHGCPKCTLSVSRKESKWLDYIGLPNTKFHRQVCLLGKRVDGFDPATNTVYEFNGDYWHGNPKKFSSNDINPRVKKTYGELYQLTLRKRSLFESNGYNVVSIWEDEYDQLISTSFYESKIDDDKTHP
jgi:hypothetical protein